jgi:hypothetical protein
MTDRSWVLAAAAFGLGLNGDYAGVTRFMTERGKLSPVDIVFEPGEQVLQ